MSFGKKAVKAAMPVKEERNISTQKEGTKDRTYNFCPLPPIRRNKPLCNNSNNAVSKKPTTQRLR